MSTPQWNQYDFNTPAPDGPRPGRSKKKGYLLAAGGAAVVFLAGVGVGTSGDAQDASDAAPKATATVTAQPSVTPTVTETASPKATPTVTKTVTAAAEPTKSTKTAKSAKTGGTSDSTAEDTSGATAKWYKNCDAVRAANAAPIHRGDPGYDSHLDRDGDGVGCES
ncbi:excalibur calcium-binding domain-containing protein [Streptomyces sp. NPDC050738]|uniref:excalibur calcium-binding domain-containing protein n=1 Tax=Streptomyces sp. NPDC050738 TaxID=3154744 RepID=UPI003422D8C1